jgi:hypothetical protein
VIKTFISAAALSSLPVTAYAGERTFTRDGVTYVYTSEQRGETTVLSGRALPNGASYTLNVRGRKVTGHVGGTPVSFSIAKPLAKKVETAQR